MVEKSYQIYDISNEVCTIESLMPRDVAKNLINQSSVIDLKGMT